MLLLLPLLAGCLGAGDPQIRVVAFVGNADAGPGRTAGFFLLARNTGDFREDAPVSFENVPEGWDVRAEAGSLVLDGARAGTLLVNATPGANAKHGLFRFTVRIGDGGADLFVRVANADASEARAGAGARVRTVGFWDNGTVFYHNWEEVRDNAGVPKGELGGPATSFDPLKVYVGGRRGEPPPEPYNRSGYRPVIQGFDMALRGLRAGELTAARIPPDLAYTQPRNEDHPLYGDALNFLIRVESIDVLEPDAGEPVSGVPCPPPVCSR